MESKLLQDPVVESQEAAPLCSEVENSYIHYGHCETTNQHSINESGARVFQKLHQLNVGDHVITSENLGKSCTYEVKFWEKIETNYNGSVSL